MRTMRPPIGECRLTDASVQALRRSPMCQEGGPLLQVRANVPSMFFGQGVASNAPDDYPARNALRRRCGQVLMTMDSVSMRLEIST